MSSSHLDEIDRTLLLIAEARECAERTARTMRQEVGDARLACALDATDQSLLAVHAELLRTAYLAPGREQLKLAG